MTLPPLTPAAITFESLMPLPPSLLDGPRVASVTHVLGLDGGATKTVAVVLDLSTYEVAQGRAGPSNADAVGEENTLAALRTAVGTALEAGGVPAERAGAVLAIAGTRTPDFEDDIRASFGFKKLHVVNDVVAAWALGTVCSPGMAVIAGTGSHVFGVDGAGRSWRTGGWGHALGDEGSGYWLGLQGLKAALRYRDGSGPSTALLGAALDAYGLGAIEELPGLFYGKPLTKADVAAFTPHVADAAEDGDEVAIGLFEQGGRELAVQVRAVVTALELGAEPLTIGLIGSVFQAGPLIRPTLERSVLEFAPSARFSVPELPPVAGSLMLAIHSVGAWSDFDYDRLAAALSDGPG
jgi:N-acetylglucosamine kinase-like BadF-type ATPase